MEGWKPQIKTEKELREQVHQGEKTLETELIPKSNGDDYFNVSIDEIKERYPERYNAYLKVLRAAKNHQEMSNEELTEMRDWITILHNLDSYVTAHRDNSTETAVRLRDRQFTVFEDIRNCLEQGQKEGYVKLPTGVGKTILFLEFVKALGVKTLIVVPTRQLIEQTEQKIQKFTPQLKHGKVYSHEKNYGEDITIITYDSFVSGVHSGRIKPEDYKALILDEVHRSLSVPRREAVSRFENTIKIGFTATPKYSEEKQVSDVLENEIHSLAVKEATEEGLLSSFSCIIAQTNVDVSSVDLLTTGEYDKEQLEKAINIAARNKAAVDMYEQGFREKSAIVFCSSIDHANNVAEIFIKRGISAVVITGETPRNKQKKILEDYELGVIKVLLTVDLLLEGFDAQNASVCFNLAPTHSHIRAEQRAGRVLRIDDHNPEKHSYVIDFLDEDSRMNTSPILFSEVVGSSAVYPTLAFDEGVKESDETKRAMQDIRSLPRLSIEGLHVIVDSKEVLRVSQRLSERRNTFSEVPEGWVSANQLQFVIGSSHNTIAAFVEHYRSSHPDWFQIFKTRTHKAEHYHPQLVAIIKDNLTKPKAPDGWATAYQLARRTKHVYRTIQNAAEPYRANHTDWFHKYQSSSHFVEHYHPDLLRIIEENLTMDKKPTDGWSTPNALIARLGIGPMTIKNIANGYRTTNPEWFHKYVTGNKVTEHFSPELIAIIRELGKAPEGWKNTTLLSGELQVARETIESYSRQYKETKPEWFKVFQSTLYYHPDLVSLIKENIAVETPEVNWLNASQLITGGISFNGIKNFVEQFRDNHPGWFRTYQRGTQKVEYYDSELVDMIKKELAVPSSEPGWMSPAKLGDAYHVGPKTVLKFAEYYRNSHPEWFKKFKTGGHIIEHLSPRLINEFIKQLIRRD